MIDGLKVMEFLREKCGRFDTLTISYDSRSGQLVVEGTKVMCLERKGEVEEREWLHPFKLDTYRDVPAYDEHGEVDVITACCNELQEQLNELESSRIITEEMQKD